MVLDIPHRHSAGIQRDNHLIQATQPPLPFRYQPRLEAAGPVPRHVQPDIPDLGSHRLARRPVPGIRRPPTGWIALFIPQVRGLLGGQPPLQDRLNHRRQETAFTGQLQATGINPSHQIIEQPGIQHLVDRLTSRPRPCLAAVEPERPSRT
jgi:hypothetical protein